MAFGKVLLHREMYKTLTIQNHTPVPLFWKMFPIDLIDSQLKFSPALGWTKALGESKIVFLYLANRVSISTYLSSIVFLD